MVSASKRPQVLILGGNFAGLGCAQKLRDYCGDKVDITLIDRRDFLLFVPNIRKRPAKGSGRGCGLAG